MHSALGVPVEWLFGAIAGLGSLVYASLLWEVRRLRAASENRHEILIETRQAVRLICAKLDIKGVFEHE